MTDLQKQNVVYLRGRGDKYASIADTLGISENTIKSYCRRKSLVFRPSDAHDVCVNCGHDLEHIPGKKKKRFCSDQCRMAWWNAHPDAVNRQSFYHFTCPTCGNEFESYGDANRKYCSRACFAVARRSTCEQI